MTRFLESLQINRYGALRNREVGPFASGLNVVYGANEAGKSTVASFVGGILFGWEEAHGVRNTYQPEGEHRSGSLVFADDATPLELGGGREILARAHNADGLRGNAALVADVDNATYRTMFHLTSDELRSLNNTSDVTARLLTAGSGTGSSPAAAFVEVEQRIAAITSRAGDAEGSVARLSERLEDARVELALAAEAAESYRREGREWSELGESRAVSAKRLGDLNARLDKLHAARARIEAADARAKEKRGELDALLAERADYDAQLEQAQQDFGDAQLLQLDVASDRALRDALDEYAEEQAKVTRAIDVARENSATSSAAYEALLEVDEEDVRRARSLRGRTLQAVVSVLLPIAFIVGGVPIFAHGREIHSLSFTAFGIGMIVLAFFLATAAIVVLFRPNRGAEALRERRKDAQWVMLQDRKKLDAALAAKGELEERLQAFLEDEGLVAAGGSVRRARALLDDAKDARARVGDLRQRVAAVEARITATKDAIASLSFERRRAADEAGLGQDVSLQQIDAEIREDSDQRDALARASEDMNLRYGELGERLSRAREDRTVDRLKLECQQISCEVDERTRELAVLLLARRMLEKSIVAWESRSQPEVYALASELFSLMTAGMWARVSMTGEGRLVAVSATGESREVRHLSLGTCQQLYLSLRIAMLLHARDVGRAVPVLADDILVHFDATRRAAAARALARLAEARQVIVFTCHRETVAALRDAQPALSYLELS